MIAPQITKRYKAARERSDRQFTLCTRPRARGREAVAALAAAQAADDAAEAAGKSADVEEFTRAATQLFDTLSLIHI